MYFFCNLRRFNHLGLSKNFRSKLGNSYTNWYKLFTLRLNRPDSNKIILWRSEGLCNFHLFPALFTWEFEERWANQVPPTQTAPLERWWPESPSSCTVEMCKSTILNHQYFLWFCKKQNQSDLFLDNFTHVYNAHWLLLPLPSLVSFLLFSYQCTSHFHFYLIFILGWGQ